MNLLPLFLSTGLSLLVLAAMFRPLEMAYPARAGQRFFRPDWWTDLCFFLGQYFVWTSLVFWLLSFVRGWVDGVTPAEFREAVAAQPWWVQVAQMIVLSDLLVYWGHRLQHRVGFLWRFHAVHHSSEHLDWLAAHREHPVDTLYTVTLVNLPTLVSGFPIESMGYFIAFRGLWAIYIHSNVRLPLGPLRMLIGSPELHHWHHDRSRDAGNYANLSPLMDIVFGTYRFPDHEPAAFGLPESSARGYLGHLVLPFLPRSVQTVKAPAAAESAVATPR